jgi:hypothetical protein
MNNIDDLLLEKTNLSARLVHTLGRNGILTIGELKAANANKKFFNIRQIGVKSIGDIQSFLKEIRKSQSPSPTEKLSLLILSDRTDDETTDEINITTIQKNTKGDLVFDINQISIDKLNLPIRISRALKKAGIKTLDDLIKIVSNGSLWELPQIGAKSKNEILKVTKNLIKTPYSELVKKAGAKEPKVNNWANIVELFFRKLDERRIFILLSRFGYKIKTLEETSLALRITRERVRQIQDSTARKFVNHVEDLDFQPILTEIKSILSSQGDDFSLDIFEKKLREKGILGDFSNHISCSYVGEINVLETLFCWLTIISDSRYVSEPLAMDMDIEALKNAELISVKDTKILNGIPSAKRKKILRKVLFTGGIKLSDAKKVLAVSEEITRVILERLNMFEIEGEWFSLKSIDLNNSRNPFRLAGLKMLTVVSEMKFDDFYGGLLRHVNRFYETIAPPYVVTHILRLIGFIVSDEKVTIGSSTAWKSTADVLARSEKCFLNVVQNRGNVASFLEIAEEFFAQGLSLPAVTIITARSPIAEKLEAGFYKIRGFDVSWDEIDAAHKRQRKFSQDEEISYGLDGILRVKITVTNYAFLTGVINAYRIKDLSGKWSVIHENESCGNAKMDDMFLWGLIGVFSKLKVQIGDRVELAFNTRNRKLTVRKV